MRSVGGACAAAAARAFAIVVGQEHLVAQRGAQAGLRLGMVLQRTPLERTTGDQLQQPRARIAQTRGVGVQCSGGDVQSGLQAVEGVGDALAVAVVQPARVGLLDEAMEGLLQVRVVAGQQPVVQGRPQIVEDAGDFLGLAGMHCAGVHTLREAGERSAQTAVVDRKHLAVQGGPEAIEGVGQGLAVAVVQSASADLTDKVVESLLQLGIVARQQPVLQGCLQAIERAGDVP